MYNAEKICDLECSFFTVYKNKIYYIVDGGFNSKSTLYSIDFSGSNKELIHEDYMDRIVIKNDKIYYTNYEYALGTEGALMSIDISNKTVNELCTSVYKIQYVANSDDSNVYFDDGRDIYTLPNAYHSISHILTDNTGFAVYEKKIYTMNSESIVSTTNLEDGNTTYFNNKIGNFIIYNGIMYFNRDDNLYTADPMGNNQHLVCNGYYGYLCADNNAIYGINDNVVYKISLNTPPTISDSDRDLGDKNTGFSLSYQVSDSDNDSLTVTEILNNTTIRTLNNAPKNTDLSISITNEMLYKLPLNTENKICIEVDDGKGGVSYRNYTFKRTNTAPIISGEDKDLATVTRDITEKYTVVDQENNKITVTEKIDDIVIKTFVAEPSKEYVIAIPTDLWVTLSNGQHKLTVNATDSNNATSIRTFTFEKKEDKIILDLKKPFTTDAKANKILITPVWGGIENATVKVETCNNALDTNPSWEDATKEVLANKKYSFTNTNKTGDKCGINIRFTIIRKEGTVGEIFFDGFGGAFE